MASLIGKTLSHFRILEQIGEGGMGVVYRAEDVELHRPVALKVLQPELVGSAETRARFMQEARAAARITHPHIATVHEIGEAEGTVFIAMEFVEGMSLRNRLASGTMLLEDAVRIAQEVADGLAAAHAAGVVHRDLKPDNVAIDASGHARILDFGVAKLLAGGERDEDTSETVSGVVTREGRVVGTAAYMSPEQARGRRVDARSDLFSFGAMLYEMATGKSPFHGESVSDTIAMILRDEPPPPAAINPGVPAELTRIVAKCLEKKPEDRYQDARDLAVDLRRLGRDTSSGIFRADTGAIEGARVTGSATPRDVTPARGVATAGAGTAGTDEVAPATRRSLAGRVAGALLLAAAAVVAIVFGPRLFSPTGTGSRPVVEAPPLIDNSVAVMAFENLKDARDPERFGQILQELIITGLSEVEGIKVFSSQRLHDIEKQVTGAQGVATTAAAPAAEGAPDVPTSPPPPQAGGRDIATRVATQAGAHVMLAGSLSQLGATWILTAQLVDVAKGTVLKSERIDGDDLYAMVDELNARLHDDLSAAMKIRVEPVTTIPVRSRTTSSLAAYRKYLEGSDLLNNEHYEAAAETLRAATELDPTFGQARYKQALALWWAHEGDEAKDLLQGVLEDDVAVTDKVRSMSAAALAVIDKDYEKGISHYEQLTSEYPEEKEVWYGLGEARFHSGYVAYEKTLDAFERAVALDPSFTVAYRHILDIHYAEGHFSSAVTRVKGLIAANPENPLGYRWWAEAAIRWGNDSEIQAAMGAARSHSRTPRERFDLYGAAAMGYGSRGDVNRAIAMGRQAHEIDPGAETAVTYRLAISTYISARDYAMARQLLDEARRRFPDKTEEFETSQLSLYDETGDLDKALALAKKRVKESPRDVDRLGWLAHMYAHMGQPARAEAIRDSVLAMPVHPAQKIGFLSSVGNAFMDMEDYPRAEAWFEQAVDLDTEGRYPFALIPLGFSYVHSGRYAEAQEIFRRNLSSGRAAIQVRGGLTLIDILERRYDEAERAARTLLDSGPAHIMAYNLMTLCLSKQERYREAEPYARYAVSMDGGYMNTVALSWVLIAGKIDVDEGVRLAVKARDEIPIHFSERPWAHWIGSSPEKCLGLAYLEQGRPDEALKELEEAARWNPKDEKVQELLAQARSRT